MDLRVPSGWFFVIVAAILLATSFLMPEARAALTPVNVNLYVGLAMAFFGGTLLWLSRKRS